MAKHIEDIFLPEAVFTALIATWPASIIGRVLLLFGDEWIEIFDTREIINKGRRLPKDSIETAYMDKDFLPSISSYSAKINAMRTVLGVPFSYKDRVIGICNVMTASRFRESWQIMPPERRYVLVLSLTIKE